jgi:hypothetical protein
MYRVPPIRAWHSNLLTIKEITVKIMTAINMKARRHLKGIYEDGSIILIRY